MEFDNPLDKLSMKQKVTYGSFGFGGFLIILSLQQYFAGNHGIGGALFMAGMVGAFLPYGLFTYFRTKKYGEMEMEFPGFLRNLSESRKSGMPLPEAFQNASKTDYGRLNDDIEKAADQISWGIPFPEVMERFQARVEHSDLIKRSMSIIMQSYEAGGDISETMDSIAQDSSKIKDAEKERKAVLTKQVFIIYAIFFLFLGILLALYRILIPLLDIGGGGGGFLSEPPNFCEPSSMVRPVCSICPPLFGKEAGAQLCYYQSIFLIMIVVQGLFNGLVAGEIRDGKASAGIKHSLIMVPTGFVLYVLIMSILGGG